jgi:hypothetical protein
MHEEEKAEVTEYEQLQVSQYSTGARPCACKARTALGLTICDRVLCLLRMSS